MVSHGVEVEKLGGVHPLRFEGLLVREKTFEGLLGEGAEWTAFVFMSQASVLESVTSLEVCFLSNELLCLFATFLFVRFNNFAYG